MGQMTDHGQSDRFRALDGTVFKPHAYIYMYRLRSEASHLRPCIRLCRANTSLLSFNFNCCFKQSVCQCQHKHGCFFQCTDNLWFAQPGWSCFEDRMEHFEMLLLPQAFDGTTLKFHAWECLWKFQHFCVTYEVSLMLDIAFVWKRQSQQPWHKLGCAEIWCSCIRRC